MATEDIFRPEHLSRLVTNPWFGNLTRGAFEILVESILDWSGKAIVYFDVDGLKQANERWGKAESSRRIKEALEFRAGDIGTWFSGDEFVAIVPVEDALGFACRLQGNFARVGMSATFLIMSNPKGPESINKADDILGQCKSKARKTIYLV